MQALKAGDPVTNICAGDNNPCLHSRFVAYVVKSYKNRYGVVHRDHWAKCKDKNGHISNTGIDVIYPGHLDAETRAKLFQPVWQERYGEPATANQGADK
jgi:hypothetical protein